MHLKLFKLDNLWELIYKIKVENMSVEVILKIGTFEEVFSLLSQSEKKDNNIFSISYLIVFL